MLCYISLWCCRLNLLSFAGLAMNEEKGSHDSLNSRRRRYISIANGAEFVVFTAFAFYRSFRLERLVAIVCLVRTFNLFCLDVKS